MSRSVWHTSTSLFIFCAFLCILSDLGKTHTCKTHKVLIFNIKIAFSQSFCLKLPFGFKVCIFIFFGCKKTTSLCKVGILHKAYILILNPAFFYAIIYIFFDTKLCLSYKSCNLYSKVIYFATFYACLSF